MQGQNEFKLSLKSLCQLSYPFSAVQSEGTISAQTVIYLFIRQIKIYNL